MIIVDDVNDNAPVVTADTTDIRILENTYLTLPIDRLTVNDIDLVNEKIKKYKEER